MSNDTGISVVYSRGTNKWRVYSVNMSSDYHSLESEHDTRTEAIEAAADAAQYPVEYGIIHIDPPTPVNQPIPTNTGVGENYRKMACIVCAKEIKPYEPGTCLHEKGWQHHLACSVNLEFMDAITEARLSALGEINQLIKEANHD